MTDSVVLVIFGIISLIVFVYNRHKDKVIRDLAVKKLKAERLLDEMRIIHEVNNSDIDDLIKSEIKRKRDKPE